MTEWRKSSYSNPSGNCVQVAALTAEPGDGLDGPRARFLAYTFWRSRHTDSYWAMPRSGDTLIEKETTEALAEAIEAGS